MWSVGLAGRSFLGECRVQSGQQEAEGSDGVGEWLLPLFDDSVFLDYEKRKALMQMLAVSIHRRKRASMLALSAFVSIPLPSPSLIPSRIITVRRSVVSRAIGSG